MGFQPMNHGQDARATNENEFDRFLASRRENSVRGASYRSERFPIRFCVSGFTPLFAMPQTKWERPGIQAIHLGSW